MNIIRDLAEYIHNITGITVENARLSIITVLIILAIIIIKWIIKNIYYRVPAADRTKFTQNRKIQIVLNIVIVIFLVLIWSDKLGNMFTLISFVSAGFAIAIRDIILNFFAGIYIRMSKPFSIEDRIEVNDIKGDVINKSALGFEVLEVGDRVNGEQSTGRIVHIPNSFVFTYPLKNYVKAFKYIWNEIKIDVEIDSDLEETKNIIYKILENNEVLKTIPKKMEDAIDEVTLEYRIYFNNLEPIIYTKIEGNHISLDVRYLVHPKKARNVEDEIYKQILEEYKAGRIKLHKD